jgi:deoxyribonuclease-4
MFLGAHESISQGIYKSILRAYEDGCESLQIFIKNANRWLSKPINNEIKKRFIDEAKEFGFEKICAHSTYLINLASNSDIIYKKSIECYERELSMCDELNIPYYVIHPGSFKNSTLKEGIARVSQSIKNVYVKDNYKVMTLLETTAGQGSSIGCKFEHLSEIIYNNPYEKKLGICLDTCHLYAAGYDIVNNYDEIVEEILLNFKEKCKVIHINDTKVPCNSKKDRHERIMEGNLGKAFFEKLVNDERFEDALGILETEKDPDNSYKKQLSFLKSLRSSL